jgi:hypothetical protein
MPIAAMSPASMFAPTSAPRAAWSWLSQPLPCRSVRRIPEQGLDELSRVELLQILDRFADTDKMHRNPKFVREADDHAPLRRPVHLGENEPGHVGDLGKEPGLGDRVLSGIRIELQ